MRTLAAEHLKESCGYMVDIAKKLAHSCVSQRDIQVSDCILGVPLLPCVSSLLHCHFCAHSILSARASVDLCVLFHISCLLVEH